VAAIVANPLRRLVELVGIERFSRQWNLQVADYTIGEMGKMGGKCSVLVQPLYSEASSAATIHCFPVLIIVSSLPGDLVPWLCGRNTISTIP
jgi:hypothetical protein